MNKILMFISALLMCWCAIMSYYIYTIKSNDIQSQEEITNTCEDTYCAEKIDTVDRDVDTIKSTRVQFYKGITYTCLDTYYLGEIKTNDIKFLPQTVQDTNRGCIYSFVIYYDKIYYVTGLQGSDNVLGYIYRCNLDGSDNELIANDAEVGNLFLSEGCLYYDVLYDYDNFHGRNLCGGIMKINLNTGEYGKIVNDDSADIINMLDDNIFYHTYDNIYDTYRYHCINLQSGHINEISEYDVEVVADIISDGVPYAGIDGEIYELDWDYNKRRIGSAARTVSRYDADYSYATVENVTGGYIYYRMYFCNPALRHGTASNVAMYRMPVSGGSSSLVAMWFVS